MFKEKYLKCENNKYIILTNFLGVNAANANAKASPTMKNASKDPKMFANAKTIDPAWLAQTKMETANMVNAHKLLVSFYVCYFSRITFNFQKKSSGVSTES